jgi:hypothetical protein
MRAAGRGRPAGCTDDQGGKRARGELRPARALPPRAAVRPGHHCASLCVCVCVCACVRVCVCVCVCVCVLENSLSLSFSLSFSLSLSLFPSLSFCLSFYVSLWFSHALTRRCSCRTRSCASRRRGRGTSSAIALRSSATSSSTRSSPLVSCVSYFVLYCCDPFVELTENTLTLFFWLACVSRSHPRFGSFKSRVGAPRDRTLTVHRRSSRAKRLASCSMTPTTTGSTTPLRCVSVPVPLCVCMCVCVCVCVTVTGVMLTHAPVR